LIYGLKQLRYKLRLKDEKNVIRSYRYLKHTQLNKNTKNLIKEKLKDIENFKNTHELEIKSSFINDYDYAIHPDDLNEAAETFNSLKIDKNLSLNINRYSYQYNRFEQFKFKKLYTKRPHTLYFRCRNLTSFDMIIQVYSMLTGVWYMRKAKVSGRTVLIPSPLRPYRRIITVTKMLMRGIRKRRKLERFDKRAMIQSIGKEFYWLLLYNGFQYGLVSIDNSEVWGEKMASHKELVANLKNIKHLKYF
jgi:hypothetical protein